MTGRDDLVATRERVARVEASLDGVRGAVESLHATVRELADSIATHHRITFEELRAMRVEMTRVHERIDERHQEAIAQAAIVTEHARQIAWLMEREGGREKRAASVKAWVMRSTWAGVAALLTWALGQMQLPSGWRLWP